MYDMPTVDVIVDIIKFMKDAKPMLDQPDNIGKFIVGVEEAKEVLKSANEVNQQLDQAITLEKKNRQIQEDIAAASVEVVNRETAVNDREIAVKNAETALIDAEAVLEARVQTLDTQEKDLNARQKTIEEREATIKADMEAAADLKKKAQARLDAVNAIPGE